MRAVTVLALSCMLGCTPRPAPVVTTRFAPEVLAARLAEADRLASRGCYLCLKEAAAAYASLLADSDEGVVAERALENNLMLVMREIELRMPDSGAREAAEQLQTRVPVSYATYFTALDVLAGPADRDVRAKLVTELGTDAQASPMKAYFYLALGLQVRPFTDIKPHIDGILTAHSDDLSLKYRMLAFRPAYSGEAARDLIGQETGFGEVHLLIGQSNVMGGYLAGAFRELTRARELLPDSVSISLALANVTFAYARYADALTLFDRIVASPAAAGLEREAQLGRAKSLSYLKRHDEAITLLDELLLKDSSNNPGEKYYWRAWNRLQLAQSQLAYDDATTGLHAIRNDAIYRLAGMASFGLNRPGESRTFFEEALKMNSADCDSQRYLGLLDSAERFWTPASSRFSGAASCFEAVITRMQVELAEYEKDITGLSNGLITAKRAEIQEAETLRVQSVQNAAAARNAGTAK
jgi:tetratricopeptide (TPR) repeat protein